MLAVDGVCPRPKHPPGALSGWRSQCGRLAGGGRCHLSPPVLSEPMPQSWPSQALMQGLLPVDPASSSWKGASWGGGKGFSMALGSVVGAASREPVWQGRGHLMTVLSRQVRVKAETAGHLREHVLSTGHCALGNPSA